MLVVKPTRVSMEVSWCVGIRLTLHSATLTAVMEHRALCSGHLSVHHLQSYGFIQHQVLMQLTCPQRVEWLRQ